MNQIPTTEGGKKSVLYPLRTKANVAMCTLITYDLILYRSQLTVFHPRRVDGGFCFKGIPSQGGVSGKAGASKLCFWTALCHGCLL